MKEQPESVVNEKPIQPRLLYPFVSCILGLAAIWYAWMRFTGLTTRADASWYDWINPSMLVIVGLVCLWATVLFLLRNASALQVFKLGLSVVPIVLFANLVILVVRVIANILNGNASSLWERVLSQPHKALFIPILVLGLMLLSALSKTDNKNA